MTGRGFVGGWTLCVLALVSGLEARDLAAQTGTAFTYQGRLVDAGVAADGSYDFQFQLFASDTGGTGLLPIAEKPDWPVALGLFTAELDFGAAAFAGGPLWLEVRVRPGTAAPGDPYVTLTPRQKLTPAPGAILASTASAVDWTGVANKPAGFADDVDDAGVTAVTAGTGLTGGTVNTTGTIAVDFTAAAPAVHDHASISGNAGTATALAADPADCPAGVAAGVTATGAAEGCIVVSTAADAGALVQRNATGGFAAGAVTATAFDYTAPLASTYIVNDCAFTSRVGVGVHCGTASGGAYPIAATPNGLAAPVNLPQGAVVTGVTFYVTDNDLGTDFFLFLMKNLVEGNYLVVASASTTGAVTGIQPRVGTGLANTTVDNGAGSYMALVATTGGPWMSTSLMVHSVRIDYTMARPAR
jgi:hypothetical protein